MMKEGISFDLESRLIDFSVRIIRLSDHLPDTRAGRHIGGQLLRSGTSPAPNYGEAQSAESRADFIHKLKIALKELRESNIWLQVIQRAALITPENKIDGLLDETDQLIAILVTSVKTAQNNKNSPSK